MERNPQPCSPAGFAKLPAEGLTEAGDRSLALVEYEGQTVLLEEGESLAGWTLVGISEEC